MQQPDGLQEQPALAVERRLDSIAFYSKLFAPGPPPPPRLRHLAIAEPPLELNLVEGTPRKATRMDHLGVKLAFRGRPAHLIGAPVWHTSFV
jgi:hypothetical protein